MKIKQEDFNFILSKYYKSAQSIKFIRTNRMKPVYEKMLDMWENESIPLCVWADIKAFRKNEYKLSKEQIQAEQKAWQKLGYSLIKVDDKKDELLDSDIVLVGETIIDSDKI